MIVVKPMPGQRVIDPRTRKPLPPEGIKVPASPYWRYRETDGLVEITEVAQVDGPVEVGEAAQAPRPRRKSPISIVEDPS